MEHLADIVQCLADMGQHLADIVQCLADMGQYLADIVQCLADMGHLADIMQCLADMGQCVMTIGLWTDATEIIALPCRRRQAKLSVKRQKHVSLLRPALVTL